MEDGNLRSGSCDGVTKIDLEDGSMDVSAEDAGGISTLVDSKRVEMIPDEVVWDPDEGEEDSGLFSVGDNEGEGGWGGWKGVFCLIICIEEQLIVGKILLKRW